MIIDLCCGSKKRPGAIGVDLVKLPGVDIVHDLDKGPWPLESNSATNIRCEHGIEHVKDVNLFMKECHRILKNGGVLEIVTPHFSSYNSYVDPTHLRHLSAFWFRTYMHDGYLAQAEGCVFEPLTTNVTFGKGIGSYIARLIVKLRGLEKWEKNSSFRYPGMDVHTSITARKS